MSEASESARHDGPRVCPIAGALQLVGERWSLLVLRELNYGVHRFKEIQANTGAPKETLSLRLRKLEEIGVIERRRYSEHPPRDEYFFTEAGRATAPILDALETWGDTYALPVVYPDVDADAIRRAARGLRVAAASAL